MRYSGGWLLKEATAERVLETLQRLRSDPEDYRRKVEKVARWQEEEGRRYGTAEMASRYIDVYNSKVTVPVGVAPEPDTCASSLMKTCVVRVGVSNRKVRSSQSSAARAEEL